MQIRALLDWYQGAKRSFPWRTEESADPYRVWISEVMSQQSTMSQVLAYFERWMASLPSLEALACASSEQVLALWSGLGYYSRARNVHKSAKILASLPAIPSSSAQWRELPGIGPYTAAAIASICFDEAILPVDGNVIRVFSRLYKVTDPLNFGTDRRKIESMVSKWAAKSAPGQRGQLSQALMELGALVCRPRAALALCGFCPLKDSCQAHQSRQVADFPKPKRRKASVKVTLAAPIYRNSAGWVLVRKISSNTKLLGQWELPLLELPSAALAQTLKEVFEVFGPVTHRITHHRYRAFGVEAGLWRGSPPPGHAFVTTKAATKGKTLTTLCRKILSFKADTTF